MLMADVVSGLPWHVWHSACAPGACLAAVLVGSSDNTMPACYDCQNQRCRRSLAGSPGGLVEPSWSVQRPVVHLLRSSQLASPAEI